MARAQTPAGTPESTPVAAEPVFGRQTPMPGFKSLVAPLAGDFRRLATRENLTLATVGLSSAGFLHRWDGNLSDGWGNSATVRRTFGPGRIVGGMVAQTSGAFLTYVAGRVTGSERIASLGSDLFRAQIVAQTTTQALKFSTRRTRPDGTTLSFPSGHTASSFATATVLRAHFGWKAGVPAYAVATWVAASRMQSERHYLSDVIAGATVGILAGRSVTVGVGGTRFSVSPMAAPGGLGISFVRIER
jgi:hypothetical protein